MPRKILLVEDDPAVRESLSRVLSRTYAITAAGSAEEALSRFSELQPEVVLTDIRMPGMDGVELLSLLKAKAPDVDVLVMTAYEDMPTVARVMREGAFDFLVKPPKKAELAEALERVFKDRDARELHRRSSERDAAEFQLNALVGSSPGMIEVYKRVGQLAAGRVNALIRGETGTGKGMLARAIHCNSVWSDQPFIAVNCTAVPEGLLESELFGHVRGAFTGAVSDRRGRFALAGSGTIFLDEVGDTTLEFQAKLLRVLEEREFHPVGAEWPERAEARVIAATHRDLEQLQREGRFREDLYYRLRIVEVVVPPLRERIEDVPALARHFVRNAARELHRVEPTLSPDAMQALVSHAWPGNVRELENALTRATVLATGGVIRSEHLGFAKGTDAAPEPERLATFLELEAQHLRRALALAEGNRASAARMLGISKPRLYRLLEKHGLR